MYSYTQFEADDDYFEHCVLLQYFIACQPLIIFNAGENKYEKEI